VNSKTPVIQLKNVSKTFGEVRSLSEVNIEIYPGEIVGLLGDNGAGKSTLVKTIMGFHRPDEGGEIWFKGEKINDWNVAKARELELKQFTKSEHFANNNQFGEICLWAEKLKTSLAV
jgi:simple sugar transport system ATP-binding protein